MELQIVNKEIAIQLKELGFDWKVYHFYHKEDNEIQINWRGVSKLFNINASPFEYQSAPTQALVVKWLRDIHKIYFHIDYSEKLNLYATHFQNPKLGNDSLIRPTYNTYEQAEEAGIIKAIKILKIKEYGK